MSLREKIESDYKNALKSKDKNKISTYRLILSGIKDLDINNRSGPNKKDTDDEDIKKLLKKMIKQRSESIEVYKKNNRKNRNETRTRYSTYCYYRRFFIKYIHFHGSPNDHITSEYLMPSVIVFTLCQR